MTSDGVMKIFEQVNRESRAVIDLNHACTDFAEWLAGAWPSIGERDVAQLALVGGTLWRDAYARILLKLATPLWHAVCVTLVSMGASAAERLSMGQGNLA